MKSRATVLHILTQRPSLTGSGVTLDALTRHAQAAGWDQHAIVGTPAKDPHPPVGPLPPDRIHPLVFGRAPLSFEVPGMSDVMPYRSTVFSEMTPEQLDAYQAAWREHLAQVIDEVNPALIHAHHIWLVGSMLKDLAPGIPVVSHSHATGLRQMKLCPHLAEQVKSGCARNDRFAVLHNGHAAGLAEALDVPHERIDVVGAGYREELFHTNGASTDRGRRIVYVGKYSRAKGLPWLLDAIERVPGVELHVAGGGAGVEAEALRARMETMGVHLHGQLAQPELAELLRGCAVCVLPSFYEGLPLVLVEAAACGCRLVATDLPGVVEELSPHLGAALQLVKTPRLIGPDEPIAEDLHAFVDALTEAIETSLEQPAVEPGALARFTWRAVFERVERVWDELLGA
jgi:alpha-maltose-1-phosphate synthase